MNAKKEPEIPFEKAFSRLEKILEKMNAGDVSLDESLRLYEEADGLIGICQKRLTEAERRVEKLTKDAQGNIQLDEEGKPRIENFPLDE